MCRDIFHDSFVSRREIKDLPGIINEAYARRYVFPYGYVWSAQAKDVKQEFVYDMYVYKFNVAIHFLSLVANETIIRCVPVKGVGRVSDDFVVMVKDEKEEEEEEEGSQFLLILDYHVMGGKTIIATGAKIALL